MRASLLGQFFRAFSAGKARLILTGNNLLDVKVVRSEKRAAHQPEPRERCSSPIPFPCGRLRTEVHQLIQEKHNGNILAGLQALLVIREDKEAVRARESNQIA